MLTHQLGTWLVAATATPSPTTPGILNSSGDPSRTIIVTAISTLGVVLVALITNYKRRETSANNQTGVAPPSSSASIAHEDSRQNERIAVLEYQVQDVKERVDGIERRMGINQQRPGNHRED